MQPPTIDYRTPRKRDGARLFDGLAKGALIFSVGSCPIICSAIFLLPSTLRQGLSNTATPYAGPLISLLFSISLAIYGRSTGKRRGLSELWFAIAISVTWILLIVVAWAILMSTFTGAQMRFGPGD